MIKCNGPAVELKGTERTLLMEASVMLNSLEEAIPGALDKMFFMLKLAAAETPNRPICKWVKKNIKNDADT